MYVYIYRSHIPSLDEVSETYVFQIDAGSSRGLQDSQIPKIAIVSDSDFGHSGLHSTAATLVKDTPAPRAHEAPGPRACLACFGAQYNPQP